LLPLPLLLSLLRLFPFAALVGVGRAALRHAQSRLLLLRRRPVL
jgi:hypothetical protein